MRIDGLARIDMFQKKIFALLSGSNLDMVIRQWWGGEFVTVKQLSGNSGVGRRMNK